MPAMSDRRRLRWAKQAHQSISGFSRLVLIADSVIEPGQWFALQKRDREFAGIFET